MFKVYDGEIGSCAGFYFWDWPGEITEDSYHEAIGYEEEPCNRKECKACRIWYGAERSA